MNLRQSGIAALTLLTLGIPAFPQNNITLFGSGPAPLGYTVRTKRPGARLNSYKFFAKLPSKAVAELQVIYPEGFGGVFQADSITILNRRTGKPYEIKEVRVDRVVRSLRFIFVEPIGGALGQELEIRATGVTNPASSGIYQVDVQALGTEANPLFQNLGRWLVDIY